MSQVMTPPIQEPWDLTEPKLAGTVIGSSIQQLEEYTDRREARDVKSM